MQPIKVHKLVLTAMLVLLCNCLLSQHHEENSHESHKEGGIHEIITSVIGAYSFAHEEWTPGTEVHYTYWFGHTFGGGFSYTAKYESVETLSDIALLGSWNATRWLTLNIGPNFALKSEQRDFALLLYAEGEINVRVTEWFHFGPIFGTLLGEESEGSVGFHIGFEF